MYEYKVKRVETIKQLEETLNDLGKSGWELFKLTYTLDHAKKYLIILRRNAGI